jgi:hypothetical protein
VSLANDFIFAMAIGGEGGGERRSFRYLFFFPFSMFNTTRKGRKWEKIKK